MRRTIGQLAENRDATDITTSAPDNRQENLHARCRFAS
jgi:hypothetical protein